MPKITPQFVLYNPDKQLTVIDDKQRVWIHDQGLVPARWIQLTQLPDSPDSPAPEQEQHFEAPPTDNLPEEPSPHEDYDIPSAVSEDGTLTIHQD